MPEQIYIGNFAKGLKLDRLPFNIDNDAFPTMNNFYSWRGRAKRKRGTLLLGRLQRQIESVASPVDPWEFDELALVAGAGNLIAGPWTRGPTSVAVTLESTGTIVPGSIEVLVGANTYTEPATPDGTLVGAPAGSGTINYATGAITIVGGGVGPLTGNFSYYPDLPVMGLEDFQRPIPLNDTSGLFKYPILLSFDTDYSYQINDGGTPVFFYNTSFYKTTENPVVWSGEDYQQFWTTNYSGALWATNNKPGLHFVNATYSSGSTTANVTFNFKSSAVNFTTLVVGDVLWFNQWAASTINGISGTISDISGAASGNYVVTFSSSQTVAGTGIAQLMTNSIPGQDGIRWYDGDPTNKDGIPAGTNLGWVNFAPPLSATSVSINNTPSGSYYLVGALAILPYKDRLLFFSPWIQIAGQNPLQLQDTVIWSWNGTPYYSNPVPTGETVDTTAYYVDQTGKGGYLSAGIPQPIVTVTNNEDVLLVGFSGRQTRFVYTGNDINPFLFFSINSELGSSSTFSGITLDKGAITIGTYGIAMTDQQSAQRIDLDIPDSVFQIQSLNNGVLRVNGVRDFQKEWVYFSYPTNDGASSASSWKFPVRSFFFNYRDNTWAVFKENFTSHGSYRRSTHYTWATLPFKTWAQWREAWNSGSSQALFPSIVGGNPQGYVLIKGQGTGEAASGDIQAIASSSGNTQITSVNHCVQIGDYLFIQGIINTIPVAGDPLSDLNGLIGRVISTVNANTFVIDLAFPLATPAVTYLGLGTYTRLSQPLLQTKQFAVYWEQGRKCRLSAQKYLMDFTANSQVTVNIYLSQDPTTVWNSGGIVPSNDVDNSSLIYSQTMYTCPESTNIGLTPANTNLQMPTANRQKQIWHRFNTSLIGDSVQIGVTLSDEQMRNLTYATSEITLHGMHLVVEKGPHLA